MANRTTKKSAQDADQAKKQMITIALLAVALVIAIVFSVRGCGAANDHVELDSKKTVKPLTAEERQAIINNPHMPDFVKQQMLNQGQPPRNMGASH